MRTVTLQGFQRYAILHYGKKVWVKIDLVQIIADYLNEPKSKVKRVIEQGGLDMIVDLEE